MKYVEILVLMLTSIYPISYARYNWKKRNKLGAAGAMLIAIIALVFPYILILTR